MAYTLLEPFPLAMSDSLPLLARQPIFNTQMKVVAYELLCRSSHVNQANFSNGDAASSQVLLNAFTELSITNVVGKHLAFINFTRNLLQTPPPFDRKQLVVEVLEGQKVDAAMLHALKVLREHNYTIALDDFILTPETEHLIPYADIIKLDVLQLSAQDVVSHTKRLKPFGIKLLAEKVETYEMLEFCKSAGFDLFQGYFLARPQIISGRKMSDNKQSVLQLLSALQDPDVPVEKIEKMLARDTVLSFKLLRLVNSAAFGLARKVDSLKQAIMLLGLNKIKNWVNILAMSNLGDKPHELSVSALTRARMCELIANQFSAKTKTDGYFTVGLLSTLDAFMDAPMTTLLDSISLSAHINDAILNQLGSEGKVLEITTYYEKGEWEKIDWGYLEGHNINAEQLAQIYVDTLEWVDKTINDLGIGEKK
ncbi:histidine kinase [Cellvibrio zantedeschiae]|uniref:Histidine kinase n=1 Tax=Cellvibrio zantedeschiae TaxID=1237077 RepID=A0ABQ3B416_9GAMM|nr:histidine kinase [Cellvibrio zantedeschiae]